MDGGGEEAAQMLEWTLSTPPKVRPAAAEWRNGRDYGT